MKGEIIKNLCKFSKSLWHFHTLSQTSAPGKPNVSSGFHALCGNQVGLRSYKYIYSGQIDSIPFL